MTRALQIDHSLDALGASTLVNAADLGGRVLIAVIFLVAGYGKVVGYAGTLGYMHAYGVPAALAPLAILVELGGGALVVAGLWTRYTALALAGFSVVTALIFHSHLADMGQQINFMKNLAIAGGLLFLAVHGAGAWSLDARRAEAR